ncbi:cytochrome c oxidase subunit 3 [Duganella violaceipulchra]|uniref:Cytochrome c oxidase subunit 3 n=1 Tax=Duganella violaceipulchra TaxID=2849652 RepID=A0AA41L8N0_9BURK|nr:cytochrome c oxidase subunit 3 [Duganella violaceicalia]MBV6322375.1 cytochrome c oxidase subunit 3 [Duganella violaceicalia]MCP2011522.1 cytochrome c oxidase subunit 3 [Duganella violaceicalia]
MNASLYLVSNHADLLRRRTGLWVFMGVIGMLFFLFSSAYVMRMATSDWRALPFVPGQLWLSTMLLIVASVAWQRAAHGRGAGAQRTAYGVACAATLAFLAAQLWAWRAMDAASFTLSANPANSFFYLITGLHGLHVVGGLAAAGWAYRDLGRNSVTLQLCARYWHFLLALWLAMFGLLFGVTPELVNQICGGGP